MATIGFVCIGALGHFLPTLPVVHELIARGETVIYFIPERYRAHVEAVGALWQPYGSEILLNNEKRTRRRKSPSFADAAVRLARDTAATLPALVERLTAHELDMLVCDCYAFAGQLAGEHLGIATARSNPTYLISDRLNYYVETDPSKPAGASPAPELPPLYDELMGPLLARYGLPFRSFLEQRSRPASLDIVYISRDFHPGADQLDERVVFVGPSILPSARRFGEHVDVDAAPYSALVYISLGTVFYYDPTFYLLCMEALESLDVRVVMQVGDRLVQRLSEDLPPNFVITAPVTQLELLQRANVFITHAGMGGTMEALYYGVPMLAIPQFSEQLLTARRVEQLGAGLLLQREDISISTLRDRVMTLLNEPSYRARAQALGESARRGGGYLKACDRIQDFARSTREP